MHQKLFYYPNAAKQGLSWRLVSPNDFSKENVEKISYNEAKNMKLTPYCFDFEQKLIIFAVGIEPTALSKATFYFKTQREIAKGFLAIPIENFSTNIPKIDVPVVTIFSPGRCGSTLISKIFDAFGVISFSEPDFYTQIVKHVYINKPKEDEMHEILKMLQVANYLLLENISTKKESTVAIKMRSQVNFSVSTVFAGLSNTKKTIFLTRDFPSWCESNMRAFGGSLQENFVTYLQSLKALKWLQKNTECLVIRYEDLERDPMTEISKLAGIFNLNINPDVLRNILERDSQEGTEIAKNKIKKTISPESIESIQKFWQEKVTLILLNRIKL